MTLNRPIAESYWVEADRFLAGEYPAGFESQPSVQRLEAFLHAGIDSFIDLTRPHELPQYESLVKELGRSRRTQVSVQRLSIRDHSVPSPQTMQRLLEIIDAELSAGRNIYLHCWGGIGRTGTAVGCFLVRHGLRPEQALNRVDQFFHTRPPNAYFQRAPETDEQMNFVRSWREVPHASETRAHRFCEG